MVSSSTWDKLFPLGASALEYLWCGSWAGNLCQESQWLVKHCIVILIHLMTCRQRYYQLNGHEPESYETTGGVAGPFLKFIYLNM